MTTTDVRTQMQTQITLAVRRDAGPPIKDFILDAFFAGVLEQVELNGVEAVLDTYGVTQPDRRAFAASACWYAPLRLAVETFRTVYAGRLAAEAIPPDLDPLAPGRQALDSALFDVLAMHGTVDEIERAGAQGVADRHGLEGPAREWFTAFADDVPLWRATWHVWTAYDLGRATGIIAEATEPWLVAA